MAKSKSKMSLGFFESIKASFYSPKFYADVTKQSFWRGFWFQFGLISILTLLSALFVLVPVYQNRDQIMESVESVLNIYPEELELTFEDGMLTANVAQPYFLGDISDFGSFEEADNEFPSSVVVIDTESTFNYEDFIAYDSFGWLGKDTLTVLSDIDSGEITSYPLKDVPNMVVDKDLVDGQINGIWNVLKPLAILIVFMLYIAVLVGLFIWQLVYGLILALVTMGIARVMGLKTLLYSQAYKIGFYSSVPALLLVFLIRWTEQWTGFGVFPFMLALIMLITAAVNLQHAKEAKLLK